MPNQNDIAINLYLGQISKVKRDAKNTAGAIRNEFSKIKGSGAVTHLKNVGSQIPVVGRLAGGLVTPVTAAAAALAAIGTATSRVINEADKLELATRRYKVFTGSIGQAKAAIKEVQELSAVTPFQFNDLSKATQTMLGFGIAVRDSIDFTRRLGDIAAASGGDLQQVAINFGQIVGKGKADIIDLRQFVNQQVPIFQILVDFLNKTTDSADFTVGKIQEMTTAGKITGELLKSALIDATNAGGQFAGSMEDLSTTLTGLRSTTKDQFVLLAQDIGAKLLPAAKAATSEMLELLKAFREIVSGRASFATYLGEIGAAIDRLISTNQLFIQKVLRTWREWFSLFSSGDANLLRDFASRVLTSMINQLTRVRQVMIFAIDAFRSFLVTIKGVGASIKAVFSGDFGALPRIANETISKIKDIFTEELPEAVSEPLEELKGNSSVINSAAVLGATVGTKAASEVKKKFIDSLKGLKIDRIFEDIDFSRARTDTLFAPNAPVNLPGLQAPAAGNINDPFLGIEGFGKALGKVGNLAAGFAREAQPLTVAVDAIGSAFADLATGTIDAGKAMVNAFKSMVRALLVEAPRLAGMALLQAAASPDPLPLAVRAALALGGLTLLGISGFAAGALKRAAGGNARESSGLNFSPSASNVPNLGLSSFNSSDDAPGTYVTNVYLSSEGITERIEQIETRNGQLTRGN